MRGTGKVRSATIGRSEDPVPAGRFAGVGRPEALTTTVLLVIGCVDSLRADNGSTTVGCEPLITDALSFFKLDEFGVEGLPEIIEALDGVETGGFFAESSTETNLEGSSNAERRNCENRSCNGRFVRPS
jgi:hypothetical protein